MSEAPKKLNANSAVTVALATAVNGTEKVAGGIRKLSDAHGDKLGKLKDHAVVSKVTQAAELLWAIMGLVLLIHGSQFKNLFLCTQVITSFCFDRVKGSIVSLWGDMKTAWDKLTEGEEKEESKDDSSDNKHAQKRAAKKDAKDAQSADKKREDDVATAKKVLKVVDSDKVTGAVFEVTVAAMACHMVMEGGLARVAVVTHVLVKTSKDRIKQFLDFSEHDDLQLWLDLTLSFVLYSSFGFMALVMRQLAFALDLAMIGSQLIVANGLPLAEQKNLLKGETAEKFAASIKGLGLFAGLTAFGTLWQFWALVADSGVAWYFQIIYLPAYTAETLISLL